MTVNTSNSPYYDDFDAKKNYFRVLFNPSRAVQTRELTQMQTAISNQLKNLGDTVLVDGTNIKDGEIKVDFNKKVFKVNALNAGGSSVILSKFVDQIIVGETSGATAIVRYIDVLDNTMMIEERGGKFTDGEKFNVSYPDVQGEALDATITLGTLKTGVYANQTGGICYVGGYFVVFDTQGIIVDKESNVGSYKIGYTFNQSLVTSDDDSSLFDNSVGSPNYTASGADRLKGEILLKVYVAGENEEVTDIVVDDDFYEMVVVRDGHVIKDVSSDTEFSDITDTLARRTFDESGNYTVRDFPIALNDTEDKTSVRIGLEAGKAYVQGYEINRIGTSYTETIKPRTFATANNEFMYPTYGVYVLTSGVDAGRMIDFAQRKEVTLMSGGTILNANKSVRVTAVTKHDVDGIYRVYLSGVSSLLSVLPSLTTIIQSDDTGKYLNINGAAGVFGQDVLSPIYGLKYNTVKELSLNETSYDAIRYTTVQKSGSTFEIIADSTTYDFPPSNSVVYCALSVGGRVLDEGTNFDASVDNASSPSRLTITLDAGDNSINTHTELDLVLRITKTQASPRSKTLTTYVAPFTSDADGKYILPHTDIFRIVSGSKNSVTLSNNELSTIVLDNGQRDYYYEYGILSGLDPNTDYSIVYDYFEHGSAGDFFAANSYTNSTNVNKEPDIYSLLGSYTTQDGSVKHEITDVLDFRRSVSDLSGATVDIVEPNSSVRLDYDYYLPRRDKVYISATGEMSVLAGIPSITPEPPITLDKTMVLYNLYLPAYTHSYKDIIIDKVVNKRYTMRDIGALEKRIQNLEYYTSLSQLEQSADNMTITDANGNDRYKGGILTDSFNGSAVSEFLHEEYRCAIDSDNGILRTPFAMNIFDFQANLGTSVGIKTHPNIATIDYDESDWIVQPLASEFMNVNPYAVYSWIGQLSLNPPSDNWFEVTYAPDVIISDDEANAALAAEIESMKDAGVIGTSWNAWQTIWSGTTVTGRSVSTRTFSTTSGRRTNTYSSSTTTTSTTTTSEQQRTGIETTVDYGLNVEYVSEKVIDTSVIPYMRSVDTAFSATGLLPSVEVFPTFDGVLVSEYCTPDGGALGDPILTDVAGSVSGVFTIPSNDDLRFRTGSKTFRLADDITTSTETSAEAQFESEGVLNTVQQTYSSTITATLVSTEVQDTQVVTSSNTSSSTRNTLINSVREDSGRDRGDPLAQSFYVDHELGMMVTSVDLYFSSKDAGIPVTVYIVDTDNGYPSTNIIPYSTVTKLPADVNISNDGTVATTFTFTDPVYLNGETEYAFIVMSNCNSYELAVAAMTEIDMVSNIPIAEQPYTGSLFKSQNLTTWTADQDRDIKFIMRRAQFKTASASLQLENKAFIDTALGDGYSMDMTTAMLYINSLILANTSIDYSLKMRSGPFSADYVEVENETNLEMLETAEIMEVIGEDKPIQVIASFNTLYDNISPIVDLTRSSLVGISNLVLGNEGDTDRDAGVYVSKTATLDNPCDDLRVFLDVAEPDANTVVDVYFKTDVYNPRYVDTVTTLSDSLQGETMQIVWRNTDNSVDHQGSVYVTNLDTLKMYIGQVTNADAFRNVAGDNALPATVANIYAVNIDNDDVITDIDDFVLNQAYAFDSYVFDGGSMYRSLEAISIAEAAFAPSASNLWQLVQYTEVIGEIKEDNEEIWRPMVKVDNTQNSQYDYIERTYVPEAELENEFTSYAIKLELRSASKALTPFARNLRAIAVY